MPATIYAPDTDLRLLSVPLTMGDGQQLDFATVAAQTAYFQGKTVRTYADFSYQRKDHYIAVPEVYDNLLTCNYVMYRNTAHGSKWFYAFIERVEFVNQNCSHIYIKTDVFQTWLFDFSFLPSLVRRECVADDSLWKHTLPESVPYGETIAKSKSAMMPSGYSLACRTRSEFDTNYYVCIAISERLEDLGGGIAYGIGYTGGRPDSLYYYASPISQYHLLLADINNEGKASAVVSVFPVPKALVTFTSLLSTDPDFSQVGYLTNNDSTQFKTLVMNRNNSGIDGYTPKNKKLYCYPYNYVEIQNGQQSCILKYEDFDSKVSTTMDFDLIFVLSTSPTMGVFPKNYKGELRCVKETLTANDFPLVPWQYDSYQNYLALHTSQIGLSLFDMGASIIGGVALGQPEAAAGALSRAVDMTAKNIDQAREPRQMRNVAPGNYINMTGRNGFYLLQKTIKAEYARIVDDYFSRYGYRVDTLKTPSFKNRPKWDYLLTENCAISGDIPASDATELQGLFNSGLTVWHDASHFGDYSQNNAPT